MTTARTLRIGLLGAGSVGSQVARILIENADELAERIGATPVLQGVAVRSVDAPRDYDIPHELLTTDANALIRSSDIVVELIGGIEPARSFILEAFASGADVVTGNKALLASHGAELLEAAGAVGAQLNYEAAVGGAIPLIRPIRENLAGDRITRVLGIVNGTTNFILDRMQRSGESFEDALATATELGYAEADPTADVEGFDAAAKAAILARLAFHTAIELDSVYREGISAITSQHIASAARSGFVIKLLAICERVTDSDGNERVSARVHPTLIAADHPLAAVHGAKNAVFVESENAGDLMFYGAGAGGVETASAVLGDLVTSARRYVFGSPAVSESATTNLDSIPFDEVPTKYQIHATVLDQPGKLALFAQLLSEHGISIERLWQFNLSEVSAGQSQAAEVPSADAASRVQLEVGTHEAREGELKRLVAALAASGIVESVDRVLRIQEH